MTIEFVRVIKTIEIDDAKATKEEFDEIKIEIGRASCRVRA